MTKLRKSLPAVISVAALLVMAAALLTDGPPVTRCTVALIALTAWCGGIMWIL
ncbi:MAG: hypothetical protein ACLVML_09000 [Candidatus Gastranaerophilaceae bacterium]|jgi:hypothetical protein|nr:hypothetical protein [Christensenellales bacterium]